MIDNLLSKCGLVRKSRHDRLVTKYRRMAYADGFYAMRQASAEWNAEGNRRVARFRLEAAQAIRQRDAMQGALDRANRRLEEAGLMPVVTFV